MDWTMVPPSTSVIVGLPPLIFPTKYDSITASIPKAKENTDVITMLLNKIMESAAPKPAPFDTPSMPLETRGFLKSP